MASITHASNLQTVRLPFRSHFHLLLLKELMVLVFLSCVKTTAVHSNLSASGLGLFTTHSTLAAQAVDELVQVVLLS